MDRWKTPLEIAQRDIAKAEARVARQAALVAKLKAEGRDTTQDEAILESHKTLLRFLREDLEYLKTQAGVSRLH